MTSGQYDISRCPGLFFQKYLWPNTGCTIYASHELFKKYHSTGEPASVWDALINLRFMTVVRTALLEPIVIVVAGALAGKHAFFVAPAEDMRS
jgi:hypothetical protein